jgi:exopolyphosphatase / guanosine-5'-triphosphate,3'-diphosphate pyrophosphatase
VAPGSTRIGAAVDLGSTSVHLLVADVVEHRIEPLVDESVFLGLGEAVAARGSLDEAGRQGLVDVLGRYASLARESRAEHITFVGTEPLRRLADASRIVDDVHRGTGLPLHVLSHEEEAFLVLIGVTAGRPVEHDLLVADVGGGSSELVLVGPERRAVAAGLPVGATRLTGQFVANDPPGPDEVAALRAAAREAVSAAPAFRPAEVVLVGGPASNLLKVVPGGPDSRRLGSGALEAAFRLVETESSEAIASRHGLRPARARILGAGAAIVEAIMFRFGVTEVRVADGGIREGTILAVAHAGSSWRDQLERLAHGWVTESA